MAEVIHGDEYIGWFDRWEHLRYFTWTEFRCVSELSLWL